MRRDRRRALEALARYLKAVDERDAWYAHTSVSGRGEQLNDAVEERQHEVRRHCEALGTTWDKLVLG